MHLLIYKIVLLFSWFKFTVSKLTWSNIYKPVFLNLNTNMHTDKSVQGKIQINDEIY